MDSGHSFGVLTQNHIVKNSLFTNNWQCFHQPIHFLINFLKQNAGDTRDNRFGNDPFLHVDCLLNHSQEMTTKVSYFNQHFHVEIMKADQSGRVLETLDDGFNWAIIRAGIFDWTSQQVWNAHKYGHRLISYPQNTITTKEVTEVLRA